MKAKRKHAQAHETEYKLKAYPNIRLFKVLLRSTKGSVNCQEPFASTDTETNRAQLELQGWRENLSLFSLMKNL